MTPPLPSDAIETILSYAIAELRKQPENARGPFVITNAMLDETERAITAYAARPSVSPSIEARRVKPLEWHKSHIKPWNGDYHTMTGGYSIRCADENGWKWSCPGGFGYCPSPESAMADVQRYHERFVLEALAKSEAE